MDNVPLSEGGLWRSPAYRGELKCKDLGSESRLLGTSQAVSQEPLNIRLGAGQGQRKEWDSHRRDKQIHHYLS